nr:MAG TPA: hypothetical protein [Caudoviricetes sp.]
MQYSKFYLRSMISHLSFSIQNQAYQKPYILHNIQLSFGNLHKQEYPNQYYQQHSVINLL